MIYTLIHYLILGCGCVGVVDLAVHDAADMRVVGLVLINLSASPISLHLFAQQRSRHYALLCQRAAISTPPLARFAWWVYAVLIAIAGTWVSVGIGIMLLPHSHERLFGLVLEALVAPLIIHGMTHIARRDAFTQVVRAVAPTAPPTTPL